MGGARFNGVELQEADFDQANLRGAWFANVDLRKVTGLTQDQVDSAGWLDIKLPAGLHVGPAERR